MTMIQTVIVLGCLLAGASAQGWTGTPPITQPTISKVYLKGPFSFSVIGDWGRLQTLASLVAPPNGLDRDGQCLARGFGPSDPAGSVGQVTAAKTLDGDSRKYLSQFIISTGDNFYECGSEDAARIDRDWRDVYKGEYIRSKKWFQTIGNHDLPRDSVAVQLNYTRTNPRWIMPGRYYAVDYISTSPTRKSTITMRVVYINTNPFVSSYSKSTNKYFGAEINATATPAAISAQLDWINATLRESKADYKIVVGHHPMVSSSDSVFGPFTNYINNQSSVSVDPGMSDFNKVPAWTRLRDIINQNGVAAYFNGHDHIMTHTVDPIDPVKYKTQYITTGAGGIGELSGGCGIGVRPWVKWVGAAYTNSSCAKPAGVAWVGYNVVHVDKGGMSIEYFVLKDYKVAKSQRVYTVRIPCPTGVKS